MTLIAFTASESSRRGICLVAAAAHSDCFLHVTNTLSYLLTLLTVSSQSWIMLDSRNLAGFRWLDSVSIML